MDSTTQGSHLDPTETPYSTLFRAYQRLIQQDEESTEIEDIIIEILKIVEENEPTLPASALQEHILAELEIPNVFNPNLSKLISPDIVLRLESLSSSIDSAHASLTASNAAIRKISADSAPIVSEILRLLSDVSASKLDKAASKRKEDTRQALRLETQTSSIIHKTEQIETRSRKLKQDLLVGEKEMQQLQEELDKPHPIKAELQAIQCREADLRAEIKQLEEQLHLHI
eukprot:gnl/Dysnectes_brevis/4986_a6968_503.p1 GENE.gnl/Dysnectes_brevis/4986_a6968_503~~gnl/Dysnectes_brevis/4986_a6968_503.p1  ORF type:complete len:229 (+),score=25.20 gnl/Dysnectes_brevis/4986_a6968_503:268-954(+)